MGGCAGVFYLIYKGSEPVAMLGADYLRKAPKVQDHIGRDAVVNRHKLGWNVNVVNDGGHARFTYSVRGELGSGEAVVWMIRSAGKWSVAGARVSPDVGSPFTLGKPPAEPHLQGDD